MGTPVFLLQIVSPEGQCVTFPGGGPMELDLIARCIDATMAAKPGALWTDERVRQAVATGVEQTIRGLKMETLKVV